MSIPTDKELANARHRFEQLMSLVALGQVPLETVSDAVKALTPEKGTQLECIPWSVDCTSPPEIKDAKVISHHAYGDLQVTVDGLLSRTMGDLQIDPGLLKRFLTGRPEGALPMHIDGKLLAAANLALYLFERQHLIPSDWGDKTVVMPGTVYESKGERPSRFVLGLQCISPSYERTMFGPPKEMSPGSVKLVHILLSELRYTSGTRSGGLWCAVMLNR